MNTCVLIVNTAQIRRGNVVLVRLVFGDEATALFIYCGVNVHAPTCAQSSTLHWGELLTLLIHWLVSASRPYIKATAALHLQGFSQTAKQGAWKRLSAGHHPRFIHSCSARALPGFDSHFVMSANWRQRHHVVCKEGTVHLFHTEIISMQWCVFSTSNCRKWRVVCVRHLENM